jgi:hypothetical protein
VLLLGGSIPTAIEPTHRESIMHQNLRHNQALSFSKKLANPVGALTLFIYHAHLRRVAA